MSRKNDVLDELTLEQLNNVDYLMVTASNFSQESKLMTFVDDIRSSFGVFIGHAATFFTSQKVGNFKPVTVIPGKLTQYQTAEGYSQINGKIVPIPVGFKGKYIDYVTALGRALDKVAVLEKTLSTCSQQLALISSEPDRMKSQSALHKLESSLDVLNTEDLNVLRAFTSNHGKDMGRFGDVFNNASEIMEVYGACNALNAKCAKVDWRAIDTKTTRLAELIKSVQGEISGVGSGGVSGTTASALSATVHGLATTVSAAALVVSGVQELTQCLLAMSAEA